jgi:hypothetical protein
MEFDANFAIVVVAIVAIAIVGLDKPAAIRAVTSAIRELSKFFRFH